ncbi:TIGR03936 family radical SAM-associated protein [Jiangella gansuensis]|uniref:TIGR03936 family radical SAM-associated protein n=1 Tax=Jiangella gansuensis TaxID=281473 RepID=UPI0004BA6D88|nr:TIGR03936 family radical SAM-associated protein [Jiangella gansuensis]
MQKLRVRFAKRGRLRFTSHRDFQRAFERALRRADVPMAYSHGFTPHPKVSYAGATPTGAASEAEYLELSLTRVCDPGDIRAALDRALPPGLDIVEVVEAGAGALADRLQASRWRIELPGADGAEVAAAVETFLAADSVEVERLTKNGVRRLDPRQAVLSASVDSADDPVTVRLVVQHQSPTVRPEEVLAGLRSVAGFVPPAPPRSVRLGQGIWDGDDDTLRDPLAADRRG